MACSQHGNKVDLQIKRRSLRFWVTGVGPYGCSHGLVFLNLIRHANPFSKYTDIRGPLDLHAVAHRLRTIGIDQSYSIDFNRGPAG